MHIKQHGFSFINLVLVFIVLGFATLFGVKALPAYIQNADVKDAMEKLNSDPLIKTTKGRMLIKQRVIKLLDHQFNMRHIDDIDLNKDLTLTYMKDNIDVRIKYSVTVPFIGNSDLVLRFDDHAKIYR